MLFLLQLTGTWMALHSRLSGETRCLDAEYFHFPMAQALWEGRGPLQYDGQFCTHQPPGYAVALMLPLAVARAAGISEVAMSRFVNIGFGTVAGLAIFAMLRKRTGGGVAGIASAVTVCLPQFLWLCRNGYNEPMFTALLLWAVVLAQGGTRGGERRPMIAAAMLFAAATLTRSIGLLVPLIVAFVCVCAAADRREAAVNWIGALVIYALLLAPWVTVVSVKLGRFTPVTSSLVPSHVDGLVWTQSPGIAGRAAEYFNAHGRTGEAVREFHRLEFARSPFDYVAFWVRKALESTYASESRRGQIALGALTIPLLLAGAGAMVWRWRRMARVQPEIAVAIATFGYFFVMDTLVWSTVRYLVPVLWVPIALMAWAATSRDTEHSST